MHLFEYKRRRPYLSAFMLGMMLTLVARDSHARADEFLAGQLLVAGTAMADPRFAESVLYMVKHDLDGAMGLVINRPIAKGSIENVLKGFGIMDEQASGEIVLHYGGPVSHLAGFILHSDDVMLENSSRDKNGIVVTADIKLIQRIAQRQGPQQYLLVLGHAGWAPGQLEAELLAGAWHAIPADKALIFDGDADRKWRRAMDKRQVPL